MRKTLAVSFLVLFGVVGLAAQTMAERAVAVIRGTVEGSTLSGQTVFEETNGSIRIEATLVNAPPGKHGFHIHQYGSCENGGEAAGGHYNPDGVQHGHLVQDGFEKAHAGDLGNIEVQGDGTGQLGAIVPMLSVVRGRYAVAGRAVVVHEMQDDFGQPTGNAGKRIGCGTIAIA